MGSRAQSMDPGVVAHARIIDDLQTQIESLSEQIQTYQLMALAVQHTDNAVVITNGEGVIEWHNDAFAKLSGRSLAESKGRELASFFVSLSDEPSAHQIRSQLRRGLTFDLESRLAKNDGVEAWVHLTAKPIIDSAMPKHRYMAILRDITVKRRMEKRLSMHHDVLDLIAAASDIDDVLTPLLPQMASVLGCPLCVAWELKGERWSKEPGLIYRDAWTKDDVRFGSFIRHAKPLFATKETMGLGEVWAWRRAKHFSSIQTGLDPTRTTEAFRIGLRSVFLVPVVTAQQVLYVFEFFSERVEAPDAELVQLLESVTIQVAQFVSRKTEELRVRQFMREFDCLFKLSPDGFVVFNAEGVRSYGNPAFYLMTGLTRERLDGVTEPEFDEILASLCAPDHRPLSIQDLVLSGAVDRVHLQFPKPAILERSVRNMTDSQGAHIGRAVYLRDITKEIEAEQVKGEFLTTAAHELRTPLVSVLGFSELLLKREFSPERRRDLHETIHRQSALLVKMVNELVDLSNIDARTGKDIHIHPVDLAPLISEVLQTVQGPEQTHEWVIQIRDSAPRVFMDSGYFSRALSNVLANARQYSSPGTAIQIDLVERMDGVSPQVGVRVTDQGIGMTSEQVTRVCERFYRADPSGNVPGTGLGMSLVKEVMNLMGGSVDVDSVFGQGTQVTLWFSVVTGAYRD